MSRLPQISEAEYEVMKVIWSKAPINTNEVTDILLQATDWSPKTIQTLLKRLVQKGAITYEKKSRSLYTPHWSLRKTILTRKASIFSNASLMAI